MSGTAKSGRKQYTPQVHAKILQALNAGAFRAHAARFAGVQPDTFTTWLEKGALGIEPYVKLYNDVEEAIAADAVRNQAIITQAAAGKVKVGDWKAAAWNLEKKHPKLYGTLANLETLRELEREARKRVDNERPYSPWKQSDSQPRKFDA